MTTCTSCGQAVDEAEPRCPACGAAIPEAVAPIAVPAPPAAAPVSPTTAGASSTIAAAPPAAAVAAVEPAEPVSPLAAAPFASLGDRTLAVLLDLLVLVAIFWAAGMGLAPRLGGLTAEGFNLEGWPALLVIGVSALVFLAYYVCLEWWFGATLGKFVAGARVAGVDGGRIDFRRALIRNLLRVIDALPLYLVAAIFVLLTKKQQRLGDIAARTVVTRRDYPGPARAAAVLVLVALPVAAIAGTWSLRAPAAGESTGPTATSTTTATTPTTGSAATASGSATGSTAGGGGTASGAAVIAGQGARMAPVADGPLTLSNVRAAEGPEGPDRPDTRYEPGESATFRFDVSGYDTSPGKGQVRIRFLARDPFDVVMLKQVETIQEQPADEPSFKGWARISLPEFAWPGTYYIDFTIADLAANREVATSVPFTVAGTPIEPSDTLTLRNFRLTDGKDGPLRQSAAYRAGDTLWIAFDVVGFKADGEGTVRFTEEAVVTWGSQRSDQMHLLDVNSRFSYVPRRIPVTNHLTLGGMSPGDYVMTLTFTDSIGNQRHEQPVRFTIQQ